MVRVDVVFRPCGRQAHGMVRVVVTGAASSLGRRVVDLLAGRDDVDEVRAIDLRTVPGGVAADLVTADLGPLLDGADAVIHLASSFGPAIEGPEADAAVDVTMARRILAAADEVGIDRVVLLSTAAVYGPWGNNAVPLTEEAPLRPHPELAYAVQAAEIERLAADWAADHPRRRSLGSARHPSSRTGGPDGSPPPSTPRPTCRWPTTPRRSTSTSTTSPPRWWPCGPSGCRAR